jgi:hypothetical protein
VARALLRQSARDPKPWSTEGAPQIQRRRINDEPQSQIIATVE